MATKKEVRNALNDLDIEQVNVFGSKKRDRLPPSLLLMQTPMIFSAQYLSPAACRILLMFFGMTDWGNTVSLTLKTIEKKLDLSKKTIVEGLKNLEQHGIIIKSKYENDNRGHEYTLNPYVAWKGDSTKRTEKKKMDKDQLALFGKSADENERREQQEIKDAMNPSTPSENQVKGVLSDV